MAVHILRACALSLLFATLGVGCTATTERLLPWYVTRRLDAYLDLSKPQKQAARAEVEETLTLLRRSELPQWISWLREVRAGIHDGLTEEDIARLQRRYDARLDQGVQLLAPRLATLLAPLDARQLDHLASRMREDVEKQYEELKEPEDERRAAIEERVLDAVEDFVGDLDDAQQTAVRAAVRLVPNERPKQYRSSLDHIARFRAFMANKPTPAQIELELVEMWRHRYDALGPGHDQTARRAQQRKWLLAVYRLLTPEQRAHAEGVLSDRIRTLKRFVVPPASVDQS